MVKENSPIIETDRLLLRKFNEDDVDSLFHILSDKVANVFLPWFPVKTYEQAKEYMKNRYLDIYKLERAYRYAICQKTDNYPIGFIGVSQNTSNDLGFGLRKEFWNKGIVIEACSALIERLKKVGYLFITATHDINNPGSGKVMKKIGMIYCYSYVELWQPKNISVTFRMYQLNFDGHDERIFTGYWDQYPEHYIEDVL